MKGTDGTPAGIHIPHGTSLVAQGTAQVINGAPQFAVVDITPFTIGNPASKIRFPSRQTLATPSQFS